LNSCPVDVVLQTWLIHELLDMNIDRSGYGPHLLGDLRGDGEVIREIAADKLNIQWSWNAEVECLADDVGRLEEE
jgi:hypothetical protein